MGIHDTNLEHLAISFADLGEMDIGGKTLSFVFLNAVMII